MEYKSMTAEVYDHTQDSVLALTDMNGGMYRVQTLPLPKVGGASGIDGIFMFTVWVKPMLDMRLVVNVLGAAKNFELAVSEGWQKLEVYCESPANENIDFMPIYSKAADSKLGEDLYLYKAMLELGNRASDWSPAPEDTETDIARLVNRVRDVELKADYDKITAYVVRTDTYRQGMNDFLDQARSDLTATEEKWNLTFSELEKKAGEGTEWVTRNKTWMDADSKGLHMGKSDSAFTMDLSNEELAFNQNGNKVAHINNQSMHITNAEITSRMNIGKFAFVPTDTGMALIYVG